MNGMQADLFAQEIQQHWDLPGGELTLIRDFLPPALHETLFDLLLGRLVWEQSILRMAGKMVRIPRLNVWYGDQNAIYHYSGIRFKPLPWIEPLLILRELIEHQCGRKFNSVLANLYRNGEDSVAWHADDEPELGKDPFIAALSLGEVRCFQLKHRHDASVARIAIDLPDNSLLLMGGSLQHNWLHQLPKRRRVNGPRISLTYRWVRPAGSAKG